MKTKLVVSVAIALMATGIIASLIISRPWIAFRNVEPLKVTGYAELPVESDIAIMEVTITFTASTSHQAYQTCGEQLHILRKMVESKLPEDSEIRELSSNISEVLKRNEEGKQINVIDYYAARRSLKITSTAVEAMDELSKEIYDLTRDGIRINVSGPRFLVSDLGDFKFELVQAATRNGMQRAKIIAKNAKARLGNLVAARQGVIQITQPHSTDTSSWGRYDTSTIEKVAKVTVHLELGIR